MSCINLHKNAHLSTENMHEVKGFPSASLNSFYQKGINGQSEFIRNSRLPNALASINGYEAPPTEVDGDIYVIESPELDVNRLSWQSGNTVRISFSAGYDSTLYAVNSYLTLSGEVDKPIHNGVWLITTIETTYIEVINTGVSNAENDVAASSPSVGYVTHEDFDPYDLAGGRVIPRIGQVRYYSNNDLWHGDSFEAGDCYYNIAIGSILCYNGSVFTSPLIKTSVTKTGTYTVLNSDQRIYVDSNGGAFTVTLEASPTLNRELEIIDSVGSCGTNNVTVDGNGNNIIGSATHLMNTNYEGLRLVFNGTNWNLI